MIVYIEIINFHMEVFGKKANHQYSNIRLSFGVGVSGVKSSVFGSLCVFCLYLL